jgi:hypothetical protein
MPTDADQPVASSAYITEKSLKVSAENSLVNIATETSPTRNVQLGRSLGTSPMQPPREDSSVTTRIIPMLTVPLGIRRGELRIKTAPAEIWPGDIGRR